MRIVLVSLLAVAALAAPAIASAPPVGPLPAGPTTQITTQRGALVAIALPSSPGRSWRLARAFDSRVLQEVREANVGASVVIVFKSTGRGHTTLIYGLTRGETAKAYAARRFRVVVN
jgi:hypothetical protein